jgi:hypothetical protein
MNKIQNIKKAAKYNISYNFIVFILFSIILCLNSCKTKGVALRHYKKVASETQFPLTTEKKNLLATTCGREFPINEKIVTKDSVVVRQIKVFDNAITQKLRKEIEALKKANPKINIDSLYQSFYDSALNNVPNCNEVTNYKVVEKTVKDTIGNYFRELEKKKISQDLDEAINLLNVAKNTIINIEDEKKKIEHDKDVWRKRFFILLAISLLYIGIKMLAKKYTLPFKI